MKASDDKSGDSYNKKADRYDNTFDGKLTAKFTELLLGTISIRLGDAILDVACVNGTFLHMLSRSFNFNGYGVDISERMIENAKLKCPNMTSEMNGCEHNINEEVMIWVTAMP